MYGVHYQTEREWQANMTIESVESVWCSLPNRKGVAGQYDDRWRHDATYQAHDDLGQHFRLDAVDEPGPLSRKHKRDGIP